MFDSEKFSTLKTWWRMKILMDYRNVSPIQEPIDKRMPAAPTVKVLPNPINKAKRISEEQTDKIDKWFKNLNLANPELIK